MALTLTLNDAEQSAFDAAIAALENFSPKRKRIRGDQQQDRSAQMESLYRAGLTLEEIGARFGVTRERVRQILKQQGLTYRDGGIAKRAAEKRAARAARAAVETAARKDPKCVAKLGCTHAEAVRLNGGREPWSPRSCAFFYLRRQRHAKRDGIEWQLTFAEWCALWGGRWTQIGRTRYSLVLARKGSVGPFSFANCYITTLAESSRTTRAKTIQLGRAVYRKRRI
ncbi:MAG TPA: sigma factor-like helix-turn-helix DNA-binding protein [Candidatus Acidoferrales bacterium]|nr:sigma factor-like helix-turn-helix DNA-binding protein [Candidatus Acidoferrales bacterium]